MPYKQMLRGLILDPRGAHGDHLPAGVISRQALIECLTEATRQFPADNLLQIVSADVFVGLPLLVAEDGWARIEPIMDTDQFVMLGADVDAVLAEMPWLAEISSDHDERVEAIWKSARTIARQRWDYDLPLIEYIGVCQI